MLEQRFVQRQIVVSSEALGKKSEDTRSYFRQYLNEKLELISANIPYLTQTLAPSIETSVWIVNFI